MNHRSHGRNYCSVNSNAIPKSILFDFGGVVMSIKDIIFIVLSYGFGCFNTGYYYVRLFHNQDIREIGTNVTGAYNVSRFSGKKGFIITFLGDSMKGALVVLLCRMMDLTEIVTLSCILTVILGHIYPIQLRFKGGKGLSTALGAFLAFHPLIVFSWLITFLIFLPLIRRYTISCLFALMLIPLWLFIADFPILNIVFFILYALLILSACRSNLYEFIHDRAYQGSKHKKDKQD